MVGRPITGAGDRIAAATRVVAEMEQGAVTVQISQAGNTPTGNLIGRLCELEKNTQILATG